MLHRTFGLGAITWALASGAALAAPMSQNFTDLPTGHWASPAVTYAVEHGYMNGYTDQTFRGDKPLTRMQGLMAVGKLLGELEAISQISWGVDRPVAATYQDMPADPAERAMLARLASSYTLFEGQPGLSAGRFNGNAPITRYEVARMLDHLLRLGEARHVVATDRLTPRHFPFTDVANNGWAPPLVADVSDHYQVMIGFANETFRGPERLSRYQFAAAAAQTFPLVRSLVVTPAPQTTPEPSPTPEASVQPVAAPPSLPVRFHAMTPLQLGVIGRGNNVIGGGIAGRGVGYDNQRFLLADFEAGVPLCTSDLMHTGSLNVGYVLPVGPLVSVQPFVGGRMFTTGQNWMPGLNYGAIGYFSPLSKWDYFTILRGTSSQGGFSGNAAIGADYAIAPGMALTLEGAYGLLPRTLNAPAGTPYSNDTAVTATVGLSVAL